MKYRSLSAVAGLFLVFGATSASASPVTLSYDGSDVQWGNAKPVRLAYGNNQRMDVSAGAFHMKDQDDNSLITWCLDLFGSLTNNILYETTDAPFLGHKIDGTRLNKIQALFDTNYANVDTNVKSNSAGFQLALWELLYEEGTEYRVDNASDDRGTFYVDQHVNGAVDMANIYLSNIAKDVAGKIFDLTFYDAKNGDYQDLVSASEIPNNNTPAVPLPATVWLLGGGLATLFGIGRRKKAVAA